MNTAGLQLVPPPMREVDQIITQLMTNPDWTFFTANLSVLAGQFDETLASLFSAIKDKWDVNNDKFWNTIRRFREEARPKFIDGLPAIQVGDRLLNQMTADAIAALEKANNPSVIFRRGNTLVTIQPDHTGQWMVARYDPLTLRSRMARVAAFVECHRRGGSRRCAPPMDVVNDVMKCDVKAPSLL